MTFRCLRLLGCIGFFCLAALQFADAGPLKRLHKQKLREWKRMNVKNYAIREANRGHEVLIGPNILLGALRDETPLGIGGSVRTFIHPYDPRLAVKVPEKIRQFRYDEQFLEHRLSVIKNDLIIQEEVFAPVGLEHAPYIPDEFLNPAGITKQVRVEGRRVSDYYTVQSRPPLRKPTPTVLRWRRWLEKRSDIINRRLFMAHRQGFFGDRYPGLVDFQFHPGEFVDKLRWTGSDNIMVKSDGSFIVVDW